MKKAEEVMAAIGITAVADDSGLMVDYLEGAPGVYSARYAGEKATSDDNNAKLLTALEGVPTEARTARFVSVISVTFTTGEKLIVRGECEGLISDKIHGEGGFGYDPLFYVPSEGMTFAEMTAERKNQISHRANALVKLKKEMRKVLDI